MSMFGITRYNEHGKDERKSVKQKSLLLEKLKKDAKKRAAALNDELKNTPEENVSPAEKIPKLDNVKLEENEHTSKTPELESKSPRLKLQKDYDPLVEFKRGLKQGMQVLGSEFDKTLTQVKKSLPEWIEHPYIVDNDVASSAESFNFDILHDLLQTNLKKMGITRLFPVQHCLIPVMLFDTKFGLESSILRPCDICVCAPTGSGKTLAFAIPIVHSLLKCPSPATRAIIVLPTIELAKQVHSVFCQLLSGSKVTAISLGGAKSILEESQILYKVTRYGQKILPDVIVTTPGRLVSHLENDMIDVSKLRFLVIDEADRVMDYVKQSWLQKLEELIEPARFGSESSLTLRDMYNPVIPVQKMLFSATLSTDPEKLKDLHLFQPRLFTCLVKRTSKKLKNCEEIPSYSTPAGLTEYRVTCTAGQKPMVLINLINTLNIKRALCFTSTTETAHRLALVLEEYNKVKTDEESFSSAEFSAQLTKKQRKKKLSQFRSGNINILISSDSTARGIDVEDVDQVFLYDTPRFIETYIHRVGRTSRAGKLGSSYTLIRPEEMYHFKTMLEKAGKDLPKRLKPVEEELDLIQQDYETALARVQDVIGDENATKSKLKN